MLKKIFPKETVENLHGVVPRTPQGLVFELLLDSLESAFSPC